jgi:streptomycin 6-kinase
MMPLSSAEVQARMNEYARRWEVTLQRVVSTPTSLLGFGTRCDVPVVVKAARSTSDERWPGAVAAAFDGEGMVRVHAHAAGIALLEHVSPGTPLVEVVRQGDDAAATRILAGVIATLHQTDRPTGGFHGVEAWGEGFARYERSGDRQIPPVVVEQARSRYARLCGSQGRQRLLHGDLQHYNVLKDRSRGWVAIDPKGIVGELEFELGAALRNPHREPALYSTSAAVERRIRWFGEHLIIDAKRVIEWAYTQAVLSAIWTVEDEGVLPAADPALRLAAALEPLVS